MTDDAVLVLSAALITSTALLTLAISSWRRSRLAEFALRERERTLLRLSERFATAEEFVEFARSREAEALFATLDSPSMLARRLLAMVAVSIVLLALGAGFWITSLGVKPDADFNLVREADWARWWAVLSIASGSGLLIASAVCAQLGRRWGVLGA